MLQGYVGFPLEKLVKHFPAMDIKNKVEKTTTQMDSFWMVKIGSSFK